MENHEPRTPNPELIDTHTHLDSYSNIDEVVQAAKDAGVSKMIVAAFSLPCSEFNLSISANYKGLYPAIGVHPHSAKDFDEAAKEKMRGLAEDKSIVAIGETGLDYHYLYSTKEQQIQVFKWHIQLAKDLDLPLIIHSREAFEDCFNILESEGVPKKGFVFHAFAGDVAQAQKVIAAGGLISVTGVVTFKNAPLLQEVVKKISLEKIMIETDCPYLTPVPFRGQTNEPKNAVLVAQKIAEIKNISVEEVAKTTTTTAKQFFLSQT